MLDSEFLCFVCAYQFMVNLDTKAHCILKGTVLIQNPLPAPNNLLIMNERLSFDFVYHADLNQWQKQKILFNYLRATVLDPYNSLCPVGKVCSEEHFFPLWKSPCNGRNLLSHQFKPSKGLAFKYLQWVQVMVFSTIQITEHAHYTLRLCRDISNSWHPNVQLE